MQPQDETVTSVAAIAHARPSPLSHWKYIGLYCAIAFGSTWLIWLPGVLGKDGLSWLPIEPSIPVVISVGTIGPLLAAYITHRLQTGNWRAVRFLPRAKMGFVWLLFGPLLVVATWFAVFPALISKGPPSSWHWHPSVLAGIFVPMFNYNLFGGPLFEEFGWRGFLQPRLQKLWPPWTAAIAVGAIWSAWHLPLFLVHGWTNASVLAFFLIQIGLSTVMAFAFNASGKLIFVAILMHSAFNSSGRFLDSYLDGTPLRAYPSGDVLAAAAFLLFGLGLIFLTRGRLVASSRPNRYSYSFLLKKLHGESVLFGSGAERVKN